MLDSTLVEDFTVLLAYPNPFNPSTTLRYEVESNSNLTVLKLPRIHFA